MDGRRAESRLPLRSSRCRWCQVRGAADCSSTLASSASKRTPEPALVTCQPRSRPSQTYRPGVPVFGGHEVGGMLDGCLVSDGFDRPRERLAPNPKDYRRMYGHVARPLALAVRRDEIDVQRRSMGYFAVSLNSFLSHS